MIKLIFILIIAISILILATGTYNVCHNPSVKIFCTNYTDQKKNIKITGLLFGALAETGNNIHSDFYCH